MVLTKGTTGPLMSSADRIITALQRGLVTGEIPIGTWLRHDALAAEFGVSRTPVREALRVLAAQGVITIVPNRGARVNGFSVRDIRETGEVRGELNGLAAELAASRIDDAQTLRLLHVWDAFREALDGGAPEETLSALWSEANEDFHSTIVDAAENHHLALTLADLHRRVPRNLSFSGYAGNSLRLRRNLAEHEAIACAIAAQDPVEARALATAHAKSANASTVHWIETRSADQLDTSDAQAISHP